MNMNIAFVNAFTNVPRKGCRRAAWPPRIHVRASRTIRLHAADVELYLLLSSEIRYNEEDTVTIPYTPTTEDICADDWQLV